MESSYPVFTSGQILTSSHLNDMVEYLEPQDRLTRTKLVGIGVVCGLEVSLRPGAQVRVSGGCAVTSEGYLLVLDGRTYDQFRPYKVPVPSAQDAPQDVIDAARYPFFFDAQGNQIALWELLPVGFTAGAGEIDPAPLTGDFLAEKVVLLFLERTLEALRNCDINDCGDKGMELQFTLRILLVDKADAQDMLNAEQKFAAAPVDRSTHGGYGLEPLQLEKINLFGNQVQSYAALIARILDIAADAGPRIFDALRKAWDVYAYLLDDLYPASDFGNGPFGGAQYFANLLHQSGQNALLMQYLYAALLDLVNAHNEFLRAALRLDAECCPDERRFPRHVLLGLVLARPTAVSVDFAQIPASQYDAIKANNGAGPLPLPAAFRHHFIPSPLFDRGLERLHEVRALHYRTYLLALRFKLDSLLNADLRLTPSKTGDYTLSQKAIPAYYAVAAGDDLHRVWSFPKTISNRLADVYSYNLPQAGGDPLLLRQEEHNFYRVEGHVGMGLGTAMSMIKAQRRGFGLSFAVSPVVVSPLGRATATASLTNRAAMVGLIPQAELLLLWRVFAPILGCRLRDVALTFKLIAGLLFYYSYAVADVIGRANLPRVVGLTAAPAVGRATLLTRPLSTNLKIAADSKASSDLLTQFRAAAYTKGQLANNVTASVKDTSSIGKIYAGLVTAQPTGRLFDQVKAHVAKLDPNANADDVTVRILPYMTLLDAAEELSEVLSAPELEEFDFEQFTARYDNFVQAYDNWNVSRTKAGLPASAERDQLDAALLQNQNAWMAAGPQALITFLMSELLKRLQVAISELLLEHYSMVHPGMEHRGGVQAGGTLVLLCVHRETAMKDLANVREQFQKFFALTQKGFETDGASLADLSAQLKETAGGNDPMDEYVVVADFCLPYLCCEAECEEPDRTPGTNIRNGTVSGSVFGVLENGVTTKVQEALVSVTRADTGKKVSVSVNLGDYTFTAPAGKYIVEANGRNQGFGIQKKTVTVVAGGTQTVDFILQRA